MAAYQLINTLIQMDFDVNFYLIVLNKNLFSKNWTAILSFFIINPDIFLLFSQAALQNPVFLSWHVAGPRLRTPASQREEEPAQTIALGGGPGVAGRLSGARHPRGAAHEAHVRTHGALAGVRPRLPQAAHAVLLLLEARRQQLHHSE